MTYPPKIVFLLAALMWT